MNPLKGDSGEHFPGFLASSGPEDRIGFHVFLDRRTP